MEDGQVWLKAVVERKGEEEKHEVILRPVSIEISGKHLRGNVKLVVICIRAKF